jgi:hypothetical protein
MEMPTWEAEYTLKLAIRKSSTALSTVALLNMEVGYMDLGWTFTNTTNITARL